MWKYDDGRVINFFEKGEFELTPRNSFEPTIKGKFQFSINKNNEIIFSSPLFEPLCIFESINSKEFVYFDLQLNGKKTRKVLTKI